jgi:hypothetical protein
MNISFKVVLLFVTTGLIWISPRLTHAIHLTLSIDEILYSWNKDSSRLNCTYCIIQDVS